MPSTRRLTSYKILQSHPSHPSHFPLLSLQDVPRAVLSAELSAAKQEVEGIDGQIVSLMASIHTSLAGEGATATPRQYVGFLEAYKNLFGEKRAEVLEKKGHLQVRPLWFQLPGRFRFRRPRSADQGCALRYMAEIAVAIL
jgi:hypothetical protein